MLGPVRFLSSWGHEKERMSQEKEKSGTFKGPRRKVGSTGNLVP
jgi:hypothetical protein